MENPGTDPERPRGRAGRADAGSADPTVPRVGVGPAPLPWPTDGRYDPRLLAEGDRRNVLDGYRYWSVEAIVADLDARRHPLHVAIQNWEHDFNIGSIVRTANALGARRVHVVGRRRWNRRGAMVTDRYLPVDHPRDAAELALHCARHGLAIVGVDNVRDSIALEETILPAKACLVFGSEALGLSEEMLAACDVVVAVTQRGSTRSMNVGHAAAIVMWAHATRLTAAGE